MKKILLTIVLIALVAGSGYYFYQTKYQKITPNQSDLTLQRLEQGNMRFANGQPRQHNYGKQIKNTKLQQKPEAIVLSCMDSRSIPELAFDQGVGAMFTIRIAGNVLNQDIIGSMEYGTKVVGAKLIIVLGHTRCGAVSAACNNTKLGNLTNLLQEIRPAVEMTKATFKKNSCDNPAFINTIAKQNVINMMKKITQDSEIIAKLVKARKVTIVGGIYNVATGKVTFIPAQQIPDK